jgi:hypothetical protein
MTRLFSRWYALAATGVCAGVLAVLPMTVASAADKPAAPNAVSPLVTCYKATCTGLDPVESGCSADAVTVQEKTTPGGTLTVQLRFSFTCLAAWGRVEAGGIDARVGIHSSDGVHSYRTLITPSTPPHTKMVNDEPGLFAWACVARDIAPTCTDKF